MEHNASSILASRIFLDCGIMVVIEPAALRLWTQSDADWCRSFCPRSFVTGWSPLLQGALAVSVDEICFQEQSWIVRINESYVIDEYGKMFLGSLGVISYENMFSFFAESSHVVLEIIAIKP